MKNLLFISLICCLPLFSCKKDRTCKCTVDTNGNTTTRIMISDGSVDTTFISPLVNSSETKIEYKEVTKKKAKFNCISRSEDFNDVYPFGVPGVAAITTTNSGTRTYDCEISD